MESFEVQWRGREKKNTYTHSYNVNLRLKFYTGKLKINASDVIHNWMCILTYNEFNKTRHHQSFIEIIPMEIDIIINNNRKPIYGTKWHQFDEVNDEYEYMNMSTYS